MTDEPRITINGQALTPAQAMTVRVAVESFAMDLDSNGLGSDGHGLAMIQLYKARINEIRRAIFRKDSSGT